ncbi:uncharacterized protein LOC129953187 isoform X2 [Eupeodes corollae]|uniref:uncharacterized protein LOC129953187 isoform X2 n=1 Tax=Eupeodes corollae TaxID=290404 RepID=UPI00249383DA|nr:uncharacterized protein LOC129953187 isoform X2 [Eupeodes corollae]
MALSSDGDDCFQLIDSKYRYPLAETLVPNKFESSAPPSISSSSSLSSLTKCTKKVPYSSFHHTNLDWRSRRTLTQSTTTTTATTKFKSSSTSTTSCDILYDYSIINSTTSSLNKLTKVTFGKKLSVETTTKSSLRKPPKFRCNYMLIILIMIVKECHLNFSDTLNRIRRKTQFLLPLLILLQLLMAVPFTHCTSPPNTNQSLAAAMSASNSSAADLLSSSTSPSTAITSTASLSNLSFQNRKIADQEKHGQGQRSSAPSVVSQLSTASRISEISHRPTGGSSITSYFGHEAKIRRDPSLSYTNSGCHSCQMREQVKADNLESIKRHILLRLEMQTIPNITAPQVPRTIIENFYKSHSFNGNKKGSSSSSIHNQQENSHSYSEGASDTKNGLVYKTYPLSQSDTLIDSNSNSKVNGGIKRNDNNMQGDDPNIFPSDFGQSVDHDVDDDDDEGGEKDDELLRNNLEDEVFSVINSVYVFPTMPRVRHNRKAEILNFKFKGSEHSTISQALLHVYIRGRDWMHENEPVQFDQKNINDDHNEIVITIHRVIRRINSTIATHTVNINESKHKIPNGLGQWISIDVTQLVQGWVRNTTTNQGIVIKAAEAWMRPFITTGDLPNNKAFTVYIEMLTKDNRKRRTKRNTSMNCSESDNEERCCRYPLVVNFIEFDWTWVVAPTQFNAYFCNGECKLGFLEKYPHTHLMQLSTAPQPCCSPTKMSPLRLLYFNTENTLVMSTIPNMAVEKCSCS